MADLTTVKPETRLEETETTLEEKGGEPTELTIKIECDAIDADAK